MLVSELIRQLKATQKENGDLTVKIDSHDVGLVTVSDNEVKVVTQKQLNEWLNSLNDKKPVVDNFTNI